VVTEENPGVFTSLRAEFSSYLDHVRAEAERDVLSFPPTQADRFGNTLFANLKRGGFCTFVVTGHNSWDPRSYYFQAARAAAQRGRVIERAFLLPHRHCRHDQYLQEHKRLDDAAGIKTRVLYVGELISTFSLPMGESLDLGIWDDSVICTAIYGQNAISEWRVSQRPEDLQLGRRMMEVLLTKSVHISLTNPQEKRSLDLEEPMVTTAPLAYEMSPVLCRGDHVSPEDCSWYHSIWQYLRIFDMVSTPTWHSSFYVDSLKSLATSGNYNSVLISGTADYSMLAHVLWAYEQMGGTPMVTVVDLCETPLFLCKWYGKFAGTRITTVGLDIMDFEPEIKFDVVVTDAFLTRFTPEFRKEILSKWHGLLRQGGKVITTTRIEAGLCSGSTRATPSQADSFRRRALTEARRWQGFLGVAPDTIANGAQRYAERMVSYPFRSEEESNLLWSKCGFHVEISRIKEVPGEMSSTMYIEIMAERT
jgi:hypothetical protein